MKEYFIKLFNYDTHTNLLMAKMIADAGRPEKPVQLMAHLLSAQQVWLARCKGEPLTNVVLWPDWKAGTFADIINNNGNGWITFLNNLESEDFDTLVIYKTTRGEEFDNKLSDILAHAINHGTHHRAQIGQYLKSDGTDLPFTDYIFYIRTLEENN
ncbi:MAG: DinB family protein [Sphingobacteriales bacterium]